MLNPTEPMDANNPPADLDLITRLVQEIGEIDPLEGILDVSLQRAVAVTSASRGLALLMDDAGLPLHTLHYPRKTLAENRLLGVLQQIAIEATDDLWIADTQAPNALQPAWQLAISASTDFPRSLLGVPFRGGNCRGYIFLCHSSSGAFTNRHRTLLKAFAASVSLAISRAHTLKNADAPVEETDLWVTSIIHDLRSPIANLTGTLEVLAGIPGLNANASAASLLAIAQRSAQRLERLALALMDTLRLRSGQPVAHFKMISPHALLNEAMAVMEGQISPLGQTLKRVEISLPASLYADSGLLERVLVNLLENASRYSPEGSRITLSATGTTDAVTFSVRDEGPGIPAERIPLLFTPYQPQASGTGLGLAYCKLAVNAHGGKIWVENLPEHGSIFYFSIPAPAADRLDV